MNANLFFIIALIFGFSLCAYAVLKAYHEELEQRRAKQREERRVKPGYYWYIDNTFSKDRIPDKKVKAIVELVDGCFIYGDLTASEIFDIEEQQLTWNEAKKFFEEFSYPCVEYEKIVWYDISQLHKVQKAYYLHTYKTLIEMQKIPRHSGNWSCSECCSLKENAFIMDFEYKDSFDTPKANKFAVRPVIGMLCRDVTLLSVTTL